MNLLSLSILADKLARPSILGFDVTGRLMILSSDTSHHRAFITKLNAMGVIFDKAIFETTSVTAGFDITNPFEKEQQNFENDMWSGWMSLDGMNISEVENVNSTDSIRIIRENKPDRAVVFGTRKLNPEVIKLFPKGLLNIHRGIISEYRGLDSDLWAIYHKDFDNIGVTVHDVDEELDTGAIFEVQRLLLDKLMRCAHIRYHTTEIAIKLIYKSIQKAEDEQFHPTPQKKLGRYYSFMPTDLKSQVQKRFNQYCSSM